MAEHDSTFIINDVVLDIPPEQIQVNKTNALKEMKALRSNSSMKTKSGKTNAVISLNVTFVDKDTINNDLRRLVAQFALTPFCYVDNQYLKDAILGEDAGDANMALALQNLTINTVPGSPGTLSAHFQFIWFNYRPYTPNFRFKDHPFVPLGQKRPGTAFQLFYLPQLRKHEAVDFLGSSMSMSQLEFLVSKSGDLPEDEGQTLDISKPRLDDFNRLLEEFTDITNKLDETHTDIAAVNSSAYQNLTDAALALGVSGPDSTVTTASISQAVRLSAEITEVFKENDIQSTLNSRESENIERLVAKQKEILNSSAYLFSGGQVWLEFPKELVGGLSTHGKNDPGKIYYRARTLPMGTEADGVIVEQISISHGNLLSILPMVGHQYPTVQYLGSSDVRFSVKLKVLNDEAHRAYTTFLNVYNSNINNGKFIPQQYTNVFVDNELFSFMGIKDVMIQDSSESTAPGEVGTYDIVLDVVERGVEPEETEQIKAIPTSFGEVRKTVWKAIWRNIIVGSRPTILPRGQGARPEARDFLQPLIDNFILPTVEDMLLKIRTTLSSEDTAGYGELGAIATNIDVGAPVQKLGLFDFRRNKDAILPSLQVMLLMTGITDDEVLGVEGLTNMIWSWADDEEGINASVLDEYDIRNPLYKAGVDVARQNMLQKKRDNVSNTAQRYKAIQKAQEGIEVWKKALASGGDQVSTLTVRDVNGDLVSLDKVLDDAGVTKNFREKVIQAGSATSQRLRRAAASPESNFFTSFVNNGIASFLEYRAGATQEDFIEDFLDQLSLELEALERQEQAGETPGDLVQMFTRGAPPFRKWAAQTREIADTVINSDIIDLEMFAEAKELLEQLRASSSGNVYHDFPLGEIRANLEKVYGTQLPSDVTIEPDFYFLNETADLGINSIVSPNEVERAVTLSTQYAQDVVKNNNNWYEQAYLKELNPSFRSFLKNSTDKIDMASPYTNVKATSSLAQLDKTPSAGRLSTNNTTYTKSTRTIFGQSSLNKIPANAGPPRAVHSLNDFIDNPDYVLHIPNTVISKDGQRAAASDEWVMPVEGHAVITSVPGKRNVKGGSKYHLGTDIDLIGTAVRYPIFASFGGEVVTKNVWDGTSTGQGNSVTIKSESGGEFYFHKYFHLSAFTDDYSVGDIVNKGQLIGFAGNTGTGAVHLHFEVRRDENFGDPIYPFGTYEPKTIVEDPARPIDRVPLIAWKGISADVTSIPSVPAQAQGLVMLEQSLNAMKRSWNQNTGFRMNRAYPGIHLSFIEEDTPGSTLIFDSFFNYQSILNCEVVRDREVAADYCRLTLSNISGRLSNRTFQGTFLENQATRKGGIAKRKTNPINKDTVKETPIDTLLLQEGIKVEVKLGYSDNPNNLTSVLVGRIVGVQFAETDDVVEIEIQSLATELIQDIKGQDKAEEFTSFLSNDAYTGPLLANLISSDECVSFGMWKRGDRIGNTNRDLLTTRWEWNPAPQTDNIFAPSEETLERLDNGWFMDGIVYRMYQSTIWDVFKEMELRHPEYIASPVPYTETAGSRKRMTMFFGLPDQLYFARDPSLGENQRSEAIKNKRDDIKSTILKDRNQILSRANGLLASSGISSELQQELLNDLNREVILSGRLENDDRSLNYQNRIGLDEVTGDLVDEYLDSERLKQALATEAIQPFRKYHLITSDMHIISNSVQAKASTTFNAVTVAYENDGGDSDIEVNKPPEIDDVSTITMKMDPAIPDEFVRENYFVFPNCIGEEMAKNYALSLLQKSAWQIYSGEIVILGNPDIKPYDICYVFDSYSDMVGPVQVRRVTHHFSHETGFVTVIKPDCVALVSDGASLTQNQAMGLMAEVFLKKTFNVNTDIITPGRSPVDGVDTNPLTYPLAVAAGKFVNFFGGKRMIFRTQFAQPIHVIPLLKNGQPMVAGFGPPGIRKNFFSWSTQLQKEITEATIGINESLDRLEVAWDKGLLFETRGKFFGGGNRNF